MPKNWFFRVAVFCITTSSLVLPTANAATPITITRIAGTSEGYGGDGGPAINAQLLRPFGIGSDQAGNIYVADSQNNRVRKISPAGIITTIAGTGVWGGWNGDSGIATTLKLDYPTDAEVDEEGNIYIAEYFGGRIRRIDTNGYMTTIAGTGSSGYNGSNRPGISTNVTPWGLDYDNATSTLYFTEGSRVRKLDAGGYVRDIPGTAAATTCPRGIDFQDGYLYLTEQCTHRIKKIDSAGNVTVIAGNGTIGTSGDGSAATSAQMNVPTGVELDPAGNVYITDLNNNLVRKVDTAGIISTLGTIADADSLTYGQALYVSSGATSQIFRIDGLGTPPPPASLSYVALGDSVASGEGLNYGWRWVMDADSRDGTWQRSSGDEPAWEDPEPQCHRSVNGYPYLVAAKKNLKLTDLACTGASTGNGILRHRLFDDGTQAAQPQLGIVQDLYDPPNPAYDAAKPDIVSLTLGADDVHFVDFLEKCYAPVRGGCNRNKNTKEIDALLVTQKNNLHKVLTEIRDRGVAIGKVPRVLLTTYYDPFPTTWVSCRDMEPAPGLGASLRPGELDWLRSKLHKLNENIRTEAALFSNAILVDLQDVMSGHTFCSNAPWVFGASIRTQRNEDQSPAPFHPTIQGQMAIATKIASAIG